MVWQKMVFVFLIGLCQQRKILQYYDVCKISLNTAGEKRKMYQWGNNIHIFYKGKFSEGIQTFLPSI